jgi:hypothetical protein
VRIIVDHTCGVVRSTRADGEVDADEARISEVDAGEVA